MTPVLLGTLQNNTGAEQSMLTVSYDLEDNLGRRDNGCGGSTTATAFITVSREKRAVGR